MFRSYAEIIRAWPADAQLGLGRLATFAHDIGVGEETAKQMRKRDAIASTYWEAIVAKGALRGVPVSLELLASLKAERRKAVAASKRRKAMGGGAFGASGRAARSSHAA